MNTTVEVSFPKELAFLLNMPGNEFQHEIQKMATIKLYELGKLSSGKAAEFLGLSRFAFLEMVGQYQVSIFGTLSSQELDQDIANA